MSTLFKILLYAILSPFACIGMWCDACIDLFNMMDRDFDAYIKAKREGRK